MHLTKKRIYITLTKKELEQLNKLALEEKRSRSNLIGYLIEKEYKKR
jgi:Ribbon-helix-helix protein, copG family.